MPLVYSVEMNSVVFFFDIACGILYAHTHIHTHVSESVYSRGPEGMGKIKENSKRGFYVP